MSESKSDPFDPGHEREAEQLRLREAAHETESIIWGPAEQEDEAPRVRGYRMFGLFAGDIGPKSGIAGAMRMRSMSRGGTEQLPRGLGRPGGGILVILLVAAIVIPAALLLALILWMAS